MATPQDDDAADPRVRARRAMHELLDHLDRIDYFARHDVAKVIGPDHETAVATWWGLLPDAIRDFEDATRAARATAGPLLPVLAKQHADGDVTLSGKAASSWTEAVLLHADERLAVLSTTWDTLGNPTDLSRIGTPPGGRDWTEETPLRWAAFATFHHRRFPRTDWDDRRTRIDSELAATPEARPVRGRRKPGRRSKSESDKDRLIVAALVKLHQYVVDPGGIPRCGERGPFSGADIARKATVNRMAVSRFLKAKFPKAKTGPDGYATACGSGTLAPLLAAWQGEVDALVRAAREYKPEHAATEDDE